MPYFGIEFSISAGNAVGERIICLNNEIFFYFFLAYLPGLQAIL